MTEIMSGDVVSELEIERHWPSVADPGCGERVGGGAPIHPSHA